MQRFAFMALIACSLSCSMPITPDSGPDTTASPDVRPDDARDERLADAIDDTVLDDIMDVSMFDDVIDVVDDRPDPVDVQRPGDGGVDGGMTCMCPMPAQDATTFSIASVIEGTATPVTTRMDYSKATASIAPTLLNGQPSFEGFADFSFYDQAGRRFTVNCSALTADATGMRTATDWGGRGCSLRVTSPTNLALASSNTTTALQYSFVLTSDTIAEVRIPVLATATPRFELNDIRIRLVRPRGGLAIPSAALTP